MAKFNEMSVAAKTGILFLVALLLGGVFYYMYLSPIIEDNKQLQAKVSDKQAENKKLKPYSVICGDGEGELVRAVIRGLLAGLRPPNRAGVPAALRW